MRFYGLRSDFLGDIPFPDGEETLVLEFVDNKSGSDDLDAESFGSLLDIDFLMENHVNKSFPLLD